MHEYEKEELLNNRWIVCDKCGKENLWKKDSAAQLFCWNCNTEIVPSNALSATQQKTVIIRGRLQEREAPKSAEESDAFRKVLHGFGTEVIPAPAPAPSESGVVLSPFPMASAEPASPKSSAICDLMNSFIKDLNDQLVTVQDLLRFILHVHDKADKCPAKDNAPCPVIKSFDKLREQIIEQLKSGK